MVNRIEALVDSVGACNGMANPESDAYKLRSPLLIKSFARPGKHLIDDHGRRVFASFLAGYKASYFDCDLKLRGQSRAGLKATDELHNLLGCYGVQTAAHSKVTNFLKRALNDQTISIHTPLSYFLETPASTENGQE